MKNISSRILLLILIVVCLESCEKFLEIPRSKSELLTAEIFADNNAANSAMLAVYSQMLNSFNSGTARIAHRTALLADELTTYADLPSYMQFYQNSVSATNSSDNSAFWNDAYNYIYQANSIIENLKISKDLSEKLKQNLTGEAMFIRAFWHFYLFNFYGEIPTVTTTDYTVNNVATRKSKAEVYELIISDLKTAKSLLSDDFTGADGMSTSLERVRPNKLAASALLARVYLYNENYEEAEAEATTLIENEQQLEVLTELTGVFLKNNKEAIWQLSGQFGAPEGNIFILNTAPHLQQSYDMRNDLSDGLFNGFENDDDRKIKWVGNITVDGITYYYPFKYKVSGTNASEYSTVLRLAEQYLIRAEARVQQDKLDEAKDDIDVIRLRAGLTGTTATDKTSILAAIEQERRVELFTEWGHRWFDLKRTGRINDVMSIATPLKGGIWTSDYQLLPIPQREIFSNPNLKQNKGYN